MKKIQDRFKIISNTPLTDTCFDMLIDSAELAALALPGQFVHILCGSRLLRRPISICEIDKQNGTLRIVFEVKGEGTLWLSRRLAGEELDILGTLGNGFPTSAYAEKKVLVIGGGIGVPPLLEAAKSFGGSADAILGFRSKENIILSDDFQKYCTSVSISTDDGSFGTRGFVTNLLSAALEKDAGAYETIFACGPIPMLRGIAEIAERNGIKCYVSLEERMGCGVGACLVCACKTKTADGEKYSHVCKDGSVFDSREVAW